MPNHVVLMRASLAEEEEYSAASSFLPVYRQRTEIPVNSLVVGRYSVLPYYKELVEDLAYSHSVLVNFYLEHIYVADLKNWYYDLKGLTPRTFFSLLEFRESKPSGSYVLKGQTNSKKHQWNTHMFAESPGDVDL